MMTKIRDIMARRAAGEKGFTLIELLVVVVILVVLAAIAVPIFLGQANKAKDSKAQSTVSAIGSVLSNARSLDATVTGATISPAVVTGDITAVGDTGTQKVSGGGATVKYSFVVDGASTFCIELKSGSGTTYYMNQNQSAATTTAC